MNHVEALQRIYEAFGRGDVPGILERLAEDVEWDAATQDHGIPILTERHGRAGVLKFFEALSDYDITHFEVTGMLSGGNQVVATCQVAHTHKSSGRKFNDVELHLWTFDDKGQVIRFRHFADTHALHAQNHI